MADTFRPVARPARAAAGRTTGPVPSWPSGSGSRPDGPQRHRAPAAARATPSRRSAGPAGHYRLGVGAKLPPLLLDDEEAVAVAVGLRAATGVERDRGDQRSGAHQAGAGAAAPASAPVDAVATR